jgi:hypothetical protein
MKIKNEVKRILENVYHNRDDDYRLIANIWLKEMQEKNIDLTTINAYQFLKIFAEGKLTNPESIRRMRAKLQEEHEHLRGKKYYERNGRIQNQWKKELGYETK